jgi:hypothetical protein
VAVAILIAAFVGVGGMAVAAESGVEGLAVLHGELVPGVVVLAFSAPGPGPDTVPLATSPGSDEKGRYRLALKPGSYYLAAVKSSAAPWPFRAAPGDLFCYYLGSPVVVEAGRMTPVGFNMVKIVAPPVLVKGDAAGLSGRLLFENKPLGRAYVYVYRDNSTNFHGMGVTAMPAGEDGRFRVKLPPGSYYLLARKRMSGGLYGPPGKDDYIGYYPGNPVEVRQGVFTQFDLEMTTRVDTLEKIGLEEGSGAGWFDGTVTDAAGAPVTGLYVLFYADPALTGAPAFVAGPTDEKGQFRVRSAPGTFHVLARSSLGGPVEDGEWYGKTIVTEGGAASRAAAGGKIRIQAGRFRRE